MALSLSVLLTWASLLSLAAASTAPTVPVILTDASFEHQTQASTGQTTGAWCVLFTASRSGAEHVDAMRLWAQLAADEEKEVIYGLVDVDSTSSKQLSNRFKGVNIPSAVLLRDQAMYVYNLPHEDDSYEIINAFVSGGWSQLPRQVVPHPSAGLLSSTEADDADLENNVFKLKVALAMLVMALTWKFAIWYNSKKPSSPAAANPTVSEPSTPAETKMAAKDSKAEDKNAKKGNAPATKQGGKGKKDAARPKGS